MSVQKIVGLAVAVAVATTACGAGSTDSQSGATTGRAPIESSAVATTGPTTTVAVDADADAAVGAAASGADEDQVEVIEWEDAQVFIEHNGEDGDYGFHAEFGGDPWSTASILAPDGTVIFTASTGGVLDEHGMSGITFESAEFPPDEVDRQEFLERFAEGDYSFTGETLEGERLEGTWTFTHLVPDPPTIVSPSRAAELDPSSVTVAWEPVTTPAGVDIEVYVLQLFPVDPPEGQDPIALNIDYTFEVPAEITEIRLLPELFAAGESYEFELMAVDAAGNQAFALGEFSISP